VSGYLVHLAAPAVRAGDVVRQRCAWCGALLEERDLSRIAVALEPGEDPEGAVDRAFVDEDGAPRGGWRGLVALATAGELPDGRRGSAALWAVDDPADGKIPEDSCMALPPEATR
jgi:hypothetical protein